MLPQPPPPPPPLPSPPPHPSVLCLIQTLCLCLGAAVQPCNPPLTPAPRWPPPRRTATTVRSSSWSSAGGFPEHGLEVSGEGHEHFHTAAD